MPRDPATHFVWRRRKPLLQWHAVTYASSQRTNMKVFQTLGLILICLSPVALAQQPRNEHPMAAQIKEAERLLSE